MHGGTVQAETDQVRIDRAKPRDCHIRAILDAILIANRATIQLERSGCISFLRRDRESTLATDLKGLGGVNHAVSAGRGTCCLRADNATIKFAARAIPWLPPP